MDTHTAAIESPSATVEPTRLPPGDPRCGVCAHANAHGWNGPAAPGRSHCRDCHRHWSSLREGHCSRCCAHFANTHAFDLHLTRDGCREPGSVTRLDGRAKLVARQRPFGITWAVAYYGERPSHWDGDDESAGVDDDIDIDAAGDGDGDLDSVEE